MKKVLKIAVVSMLAYAGVPALASAEEARSIAVDINVEAGTGELSEKAAAISEALLSGDSAGADQMLSDLYSGGVRKEEPVAVQAVKCCCPCAQAAANVAASTAPAGEKPAAAAADKPADAAAKDAKAADSKKSDPAPKSNEKSAEEEEAAKKQKAFNWGVTIMTVALLLLFVLL